MSFRFSKVPCSDSTSLTTKASTLFVSTSSSTNVGVGISCSLMSSISGYPVLLYASTIVGFSCCEIGMEMLRFGFRTGGKLMRSSGAAVSSSQGAAVVLVALFTVSLNIILLTGVKLLFDQLTLDVDGFRLNVGLLDHEETVVQITGFFVLGRVFVLAFSSIASVLTSIVGFALVPSFRLTLI